jgi:3-oxoacyl-[acyl-carrier-protein] synthase-3
MNLKYGIGILGVGSQLPSVRDSNEVLCAELGDDIGPDWILEKTGIRQRYLVGPGETASSLSEQASIKAIQMAGVRPDEIDLIIACTATGDYAFPPLSAKIQQLIGAKNAQVFDLQANCAGFVSGLTAASDRLFADESYRYALVVGAEVLSPYVDRGDVNTAVYISDGAGAAVLGKVGSGVGILRSRFFTDSANYDSVRLRVGGSCFPSHRFRDQGVSPFVEMNGLATWKQTTTHLPVTVRRAIEASGLRAADVDLLLFHQANLNLIHYVVRKLGLRPESTYTNVERIGNTGSASVAIVLDEAVRVGRLKPGMTLALGAVGAGFTFGANVWRWGVAEEGS